MVVLKLLLDKKKNKSENIKVTSCKEGATIETCTRYSIVDVKSNKKILGNFKGIS